jgi:hypothetical protein
VGFIKGAKNQPIPISTFAKRRDGPSISPRLSSIHRSASSSATAGISTLRGPRNTTAARTESKHGSMAALHTWQ